MEVLLTETTPNVMPKTDREVGLEREKGKDTEPVIKDKAVIDQSKVAQFTAQRNSHT